MRRASRPDPAARATLWLAWLAMLASALLPGWAHALGRPDVHRLAGWTEVCSAQGSRWVRIADPAADSPAHGVAAWLEHCPDCVPGLDLPALSAIGPAGPPPASVAPSPRPPDAGSAPLDGSGRRPPARGPPVSA